MGLVKTGLFVGGRLVTAIIGVLGFAFSLAGESALTLSANNWGIIGLIAFGTFILLTLAKEVGMMWAQRPDVTVSPEIHNDRAILVVTNTGGEGDFTATARVRAAIPEPKLYTMYWESVHAAHCHIDGGGGVASILVAGRAKLDHIDKLALEQGDTSKSYLKGDLLLFKLGTRGVESFPAFSQATWKKLKDGKEIDVYTNADRCIVEVTITATPTLKKKWGTRKYLCEIENGQIRLYETELSVPHKVMGETERL